MPNIEKRPLKVFLCHARADKGKVRELYRYLRRRGIRPWFDETDLVGGQDWQVEIPKALAASDAIIICLSKNSVDKEGYIQKEIKFALDKALEMPEGRIFLIPVRFEECEVPFTLSRYQWVDLFDEAGYARMMRSLKFRASQLERATVDLTKKDIEEEKLALERTAHEKQELEAAEEAVREKAEREDAEKVAREKQESEAAENAVREKAKRETAEKTKRERAERRAIQIATLKEFFSKKFYSLRLFIPKAKPFLKIGGIIGLIFALFWVGTWPISQFLSPSPTATTSLTQRPITIATFTSFAPSITATLETSPTPTKTQMPASPELPTEVTDTKGGPMVLVPAGTFIMGSDELSEIERPAHEVFVDAFWIDKSEVTNAMYTKCVEENQCEPPNNPSSHTRSSYFGNSEFDNYPTIYVDWNMANAFCEWRGAKLPTEAQWEKAARGIDGRPLPWGYAATSYKLLNYYSIIGDTTEVGNYPDGASIYGVLDMAGNVEEWVSSLYQPYPYDANDGRESLTSSESRITRGGSWIDVGIWVRSDRRSSREPMGNSDNLGFRCARSIDETTSVPIAFNDPHPDPSDHVDSYGIPMRLVPAGEFAMGSENGDSDEGPVHTVYLDAYYIDKYEVTNALYKACVDAGACQPPKGTSSLYDFYGNSDYDDYPVMSMSWNLAKTYCEWRGAQLPTEAQWEKAARGTDGRTYPWGEEIDQTFANYDQSAGTPAAVGSYESGKSPYGVYDMAGNVWEWVEDWYSQNFYANSPTSNPLGPGSGQSRVLRGGTWYYGKERVRAFSRDSFDPIEILDSFGFRCARDVNP